VTKPAESAVASNEERQAESFRKMLMAMVDDIRVILVKLADRLHNMRTLHHLPEERRARIAQETRDIYAPIANRLGMSKIKNELEELAFRHLEPGAYQLLRLEVERKRRATEGSSIVAPALEAALSKRRSERPTTGSSACSASGSSSRRRRSISSRSTTSSRCAS
jgi:(p)ppGpp synthase/HD superfamily hydrolase